MAGFSESFIEGLFRGWTPAYEAGAKAVETKDQKLSRALADEYRRQANLRAEEKAQRDTTTFNQAQQDREHTLGRRATEEYQKDYKFGNEQQDYARTEMERVRKHQAQADYFSGDRTSKTYYDAFGKAPTPDEETKALGDLINDGDKAMNGLYEEHKFAQKMQDNAESEADLKAALAHRMDVEHRLAAQNQILQKWRLQYQERRGSRSPKPAVEVPPSLQGNAGGFGVEAHAADAMAQGIAVPPWARGQVPGGWGGGQRPGAIKPFAVSQQIQGAAPASPTTQPAQAAQVPMGFPQQAGGPVQAGAAVNAGPLPRRSVASWGVKADPQRYPRQMVNQQTGQMIAFDAVLNEWVYVQ